MIAERIYAYPRRLTWPVELVSGLLVVVGAFNAGQAVLDLILTRQPIDPWMLKQLPWLREATRAIQNFRSGAPTLLQLVGPLTFLCCVLLLALMVRNAFPAVRTSARGLLVRFGNDWLPVRWDGVQALRITEGGDKFVALVQINGAQLTGWHRFWSFVYRFGFKRGFLITSAVEHGEDLIGEIVDELQRRQKLGRGTTALIDDRRPSPIFGSFLRVRQEAQAVVNTVQTAGAPVAMAGSATSSQRATGEAAAEITYPGGIFRGLFCGTVLISGLALWQYVHAWITFLIYTFPFLRRIAFFGTMDVAAVVSPWGVLLGAHLGLALVAVVVTLLYHLFPLVSVDSAGLRLTALGKTHHVPWDHVKVVKATAVDEDRHVVLIETAGRALPWSYRIGPWIYDTGTRRGAIIWPMARGFEVLMQRLAFELSRQGRDGEAGGPRLRDDAPSWLLLLVLKPAQALDRLVLAEVDEEDGPGRLDRARLKQAIAPMISVATGPILLLLGHWMLFRGVVLSAQIPAVVLLGIVWGLAEWPLVSLVASSLDQIVGAGTKGNAALYLYPISQLPRLLPTTLAVVLMLLGFPNLALMAMAAGIAWSAVLTAGLWEALYGWHGWPLMAGAGMGVFFQLLTLAGVVALR